MFCPLGHCRVLMIFIFVEVQPLFTMIYALVTCLVANMLSYYFHCILGLLDTAPMLHNNTCTNVKKVFCKFKEEKNTKGHKIRLKMLNESL